MVYLWDMQGIIKRIFFKKASLFSIMHEEHQFSQSIKICMVNVIFKKLVVHQLLSIERPIRIPLNVGLGRLCFLGQ